MNEQIFATPTVERDSQILIFRRRLYKRLLDLADNADRWQRDEMFTPVCVKNISILENRVKTLEREVFLLRKEINRRETAIRKMYSIFKLFTQTGKVAADCPHQEEKSIHDDSQKVTPPRVKAHQTIQSERSSHPNPFPANAYHGDLDSSHCHKDTGHP